MPTALVTGASSGIGAAFARRLARDGFDLVIVARDADRLERLAKELDAQHRVRVDVLPADLATEDGRTAVAQRLGEGVDLLINNAGISTNAPFHEIDWAEEDRQLQVNVAAMARLAHAALPPMVARGSGRIVNVSSVAAFFPMAGGATYAASKAYILALSEGLASSYASRGVQVMALCPGFTHTELHQRAGVPKEGINERLWLSADHVVDAALADLDAGKAVSVPGAVYKALVSGGRLLPRRGLQAASRRAQRRRGRH